MLYQRYNKNIFMIQLNISPKKMFPKKFEDEDELGTTKLTPPIIHVWKRVLTSKRNIYGVFLFFWRTKQKKKIVYIYSSGFLTYQKFLKKGQVFFGLCVNSVRIIGNEAEELMEHVFHIWTVKEFTLALNR